MVVQLEKNKSRQEAYFEINTLLMTMTDLRAEDIPDLVELIITRAGYNVQDFTPTTCGMCHKGILVPLCYGVVRLNPCTANEKITPTLLRICNNCSFIYEDIHAVRPTPSR